jgi:hypothetical protein
MARLRDALRDAGFQPDVQDFWRSYLFVAMVATKGTPRPAANVIPIGIGNGFPRQAVVPDGNRWAGDPA